MTGQGQGWQEVQQQLSELREEMDSKVRGGSSLRCKAVTSRVWQPKAASL